MPTMDISFFTKSKRAQTSDDFETWIEGGLFLP
jgi:hypothetical protein